MLATVGQGLRFRLIGLGPLLQLECPEIGLVHAARTPTLCSRHRYFQPIAWLVPFHNLGTE